MQVLLILLSMFFSCASTFVMSFLAMSTELGPWVAPVFVVVSMVLIMPIVSKKWFRQHVIITIIAGSMGGMVGICLGLTWPTFYFLHQDAFMASMKSPILFAGSISLFVLCAGMLAFLIAYFLKDYMIVTRSMHFPMSRLVHDIVYVEKWSAGQLMMVYGLSVSSTWNLFLLLQRAWLYPYAIQLHMIPMLVSIGFVAGGGSSVYLATGMVLRKLSLYGFKNNFFVNYSDNEFMVRFCSGIFLSLLVSHVFLFLVKSRRGLYKSILTSGFFALFFDLYKKKYLLALFALSILGAILLLHAWDNSWSSQLYVLAALVVACYYVSCVVGQIGAVELGVFVWLVILPFSYAAKVGSDGIVAIAVFSMLCIGLVVDLLFSYKLAQLSDISYRRVLKYQLLGFIVSLVTVGFIMWWNIYTFHLGSVELMAQSSKEFDLLVKVGTYSYEVVLLGFAFGLILRRFVQETIVVIGAMLMSATITFWLVFAGLFSYFIKNEKRYYPFWLGVYASHALWMICLAFFR